MEKINELTEGVEVDLDEPLPPEDDDADTNTGGIEAMTNWRDEVTRRVLKWTRYEPDTGKVIWLERENNKQFTSKFAGKEAGKVSAHGNSFYRYLGFKIDGKTKNVAAHTVAMIHIHGEYPKHGDEVDHIDGDGLNNRAENLRLVDHSTNGKNSRLMSNNKSGISGVRWDEKRKYWISLVRVNKKSKILAFTEDFFEACCLRKSAERKHNYHENHGRRVRNG
jgi:hypothetical protein